MLKVVSNRTPNENDPLTLSLDELARIGAKKLLSAALKLEVDEYIENCSHLTNSNGHKVVVKNGKARERKILLGSGEVSINAPRVNDQREGFKYTSQILPPYLRKSPNVESVLPILYLKGLSGNAFKEALKDLFGENVSGLSSSSISSLKKVWLKEMKEWHNRKIEDDFVYLWADGVYSKVRLGEDKKLGLLVIMGVTTSGDKKVLAIEAGYRESKESWKMIFNDLIRRGLNSPHVIIGDGALGLWAAVKEVEAFRATREQRCWVHKIANVLDKLPKKVQPKAKSALHNMMNAENEKDATEVFKNFQTDFHKKYPKAVKCLVDDWEKMTVFFSFPAEHWQHIRTSNPIESAFATVKLRTKASKGAGSKEMAEVMAFKLLLEAEKRWRKIRGFQEIQNLIQGSIYKDGEIIEGAFEVQEKVTSSSSTTF
jgi:transposase-like protein